MFSDQIKTIDGNIIEGKVMDADEEYLTVRQRGDSVVFIQWRIISLISRDKEMIIVTHAGNQKKFSILTTTSDGLSATDTKLTTTDKISFIYPKDRIAKRPFFISEMEQAGKLDTKNTISAKGRITSSRTNPGVETLMLV